MSSSTATSKVTITDENGQKLEISEVDLTFAPVQNPQPKVLSAAQIEEYNERGFLAPFRIFSDEDAKANRDYFDWLLSEFQAAGRDGYAINGYQVRCRGIWDLATHPAILDHVQDILGENFVCWGSHFFAKLPHDPKAVPWHQDASFWPLTPARTVTVWLAIDDADEENSAVKFIPGTHQMGPLRWRAPKGPAVLDQELSGVDALIREQGLIVNALKAGEMSMHADMLAHSSDPNGSDRRRTGLTLRYCPTDVRIAGGLPWNAQSIICRGSDPSGFWADVPRPEGEDLSLTDAEPMSIGGN